MWRATAPGKLILTGEHAVVYGKLALAAAVDLRTSICLQHRGKEAGVTMNFRGKTTHLTWDEMLACQEINLSGILSSMIREVKLEPGHWDFKVETQIPLASGLGSSASLAVASAACILKAKQLPTDLASINELAYKAELLAHGRPSGIDNTVITYGGIIAYKQKAIQKIEDQGRFDVVIVNSKQVKSTQKAVAQVKYLNEQLPNTSHALFDLIGTLSEDFLAAYNEGNFAAMKRLISVNHYALTALGVSSPVLNAIIQKGEDLNYSGKLTGAGAGGCCYFLVPKGEGAELVEALKPTYEILNASICPQGVIST